MTAEPDNAQVLMPPPVALAIAATAALVLDEFLPLPIASSTAAFWAGAIIVAFALALVIWAIVTLHGSGSNVPTSRPTTTIVETGPYAFSRNPIYLGSMLFLAGLSLADDNAWLLVALVPFALVIRYGVIAREEAYLERKFGDVYNAYRSRVRRWL
jgi:protein-S-isoprenylcysteine O-methyltransferase Ste14